MPDIDKKKKPEFLEKFYEREVQEKGLAQYWSKQVNSAIYRIQKTNLAMLDRNSLKQIGLPVIREAKKRMVLLENAGLTSSPAYKFIKKELKTKYPTTAGTNRNSILNNIRLATDFLHARTSLVQEAAQYNEWVISHVGLDLTQDELTDFWDVVHRFEDTNPQVFMNRGYDEAIRKIATAYHLNNRDKEEATRVFLEYLEGKGELIDIERGTGEELKQYGITSWFNNSMRG